jgi:hypothetical protein
MPMGLALVVVGGCTETPGSDILENAERDVDTGPYELVGNWPEWFSGEDHEGLTWGSTGAVYAESPDRIWIAQRGELPLSDGVESGTPYSMLHPPRTANGGDDTDGNRGWERRYHHVIFVVNREGRVVEYWDQHDKLFDHPGGRGPHSIKMSRYDPEKHVWVIDDQLHQIHKFTYDGELVMTLGERGVPGRGPNNFGRPTDIAWLPDGTFFISDGYDGTRVAKFDPDGNFLMDWGSAPADPDNPGPYELNTVHSLAISEDRRLFVVDRGHNRIQVFDESGEFLEMWPTGDRSIATTTLITEDGFLWTAQLDSEKRNPGSESST